MLNCRSLVGRNYDLNIRHTHRSHRNCAGNGEQTGLSIGRTNHKVGTPHTYQRSNCTNLKSFPFALLFEFAFNLKTGFSGQQGDTAGLPGNLSHTEKGTGGEFNQFRFAPDPDFNGCIFAGLYTVFGMEDHFSTGLAQQTSAFRTDHLDRTFFQQQQSLLCLQGNCRNGSQKQGQQE